MVEGISTVTFNRYRIENGVLSFLGRDTTANILQYKINKGDDEDAYFAAEFLCGKVKNFVLLAEDLNVMRGLVEEEVQLNKSAWGTISFGVYSHNPHALGAICNARPSALFNVVPYEWDDLRVIGRMVNVEPASPNMLPLQCERKGVSGLSLDLEYFTENLEKFPDTMLVHMAKCVNSGQEAFCLFYTSPYDDGFANRFVVRDEAEDCDVCVVKSDFADKCFGELPLSYRVSAGCALPTEIPVTEKFVAETGCRREKVSLLISGHHNSYLNKFAGMYDFMFRRPWFWTKRSSTQSRCNIFTSDGFGFCNASALTDWRNRFAT